MLDWRAEAMGMGTHIEWTDATWNPVTGCTKVSQGCTHCYAERMAKRLQAMGASNYSQGFRVTLHPDMLDKPRRWKQFFMPLFGTSQHENWRGMSKYFCAFSCDGRLFCGIMHP